MPAISRVLGWTPPHNEDFVDVPVSCDVSDLMPLQNPTFHISEPNPVRTLRRTVTGIFKHASAPASDTDEHSSDEAAAEKRAETGPGGKHTDPAWVARPRNEFILFRCDYVRKHSREGKRVRRPPGAEVEKTLSKQAAEAWHHLPPEERLYWKERANRERNEHARLYPDYRYRPKKSATGRRRQTRCSSTAPATAELNQPAEPPVPHFADAPPSMSRTSSSTSAPKRHASVPQLGGSERVHHRRLRSTASAPWIGMPGSVDFTARDFASMTIMEDSSSFEPSDYLSPDFVSGPSQSQILTQVTGTSSSASSSSSLMNWNDARMVPSAPQSAQYLSPTSASFSTLNGMDHIHLGSQQMLAKYTTGGTPDPAALGIMQHQPQQLQIPDMQQPHLSQQPHPDQHHQQSQPFANYHVTRGDIWMSQMHSYDHEHLSDQDGQHLLGMTIDPTLQQQSDESLTASSSSSDTQPVSGSGSGGSIASSSPDTREVGNKHEHHAALHFDAEGRAMNGLIGAVDNGSPSVLFAMDTDEFFNPNDF
ncbi:hypothetical protein D9619_012268 [Psilocybe cf. subviscida]|uniref:HMG box domain-containing protein n=1 Tax=Psilocybe cf. subviscida TaxID=2480587 RepID=A0A8H5B7P7_9AGAR|nr:hypothetical protein D9619_012268 [Psilocybe cf. subviscida]